VSPAIQTLPDPAGPLLLHLSLIKPTPKLSFLTSLPCAPPHLLAYILPERNTVFRGFNLNKGSLLSGCLQSVPTYRGIVILHTQTSSTECLSLSNALRSPIYLSIVFLPPRFLAKLTYSGEYSALLNVICLHSVCEAKAYLV
jgi:hypothetical protein